MHGRHPIGRAIAAWLAALAAAAGILACGAAPRQPARAGSYMVVAANPLAVEAGLSVLERGGNAIDAMIATQLALNVVEPSASGIGGGAFLLYYDARAKAIRAYDGREVAPWGASASLFLEPGGNPMSFQEARVGGRSVGVPGTLRLLEIAHVRHGKLPWAALFAPAIRLAEKGFPISPRFARLVAEDAGLADEPAARALFFDASGKPRAPGTLLRNPELAATLRRIAREGADAFYAGDIARDIVAAVRGHRNPGTLSMEDLAAYRVRDVEPLCAPYRAWRACGMPPSSSGGIAVLQVLGELEGIDMARVPPRSARAVHLISEAERLAFADRDRYVADDRFVEVPVQGLIDPAYLAGRAALMHADRAMGHARAGHPVGAPSAFASDVTDEVPGTSHLSIVDREGNAVAMTTTIEWTFGSRVMVRGFLLNNELTDFNFLPLAEGGAVANSVAPGKRPRSSMAPFMVFDRASGALDIVIGSAGGSFIIGHVAKALIAMLDWNMDVQAAIDLANFDSRNGPTEIEAGTELDAVAPALRAIGHEVAAIPMASGLHGIRRSGKVWEGGADSRREGVARGR